MRKRSCYYAYLISSTVKRTIQCSNSTSECSVYVNTTAETARYVKKEFRADLFYIYIYIYKYIKKNYNQEQQTRIGQSNEKHLNKQRKHKVKGNASNE
jgi:hypothetical protein